MPTTYVEKEININTPIETLTTMLSNFDEWLIWSPWLLMEPEARVSVAEDKHYYEWEGKRVGSGNMSYLGEENSAEDTTVLKYALNFLKPWKSYADVEFKLVPVKESSQVKVIWTMRSSLPFFLFWMKNSIQNFVGMDYERGLNMLKEYAEENTVSSNIEFLGEREQKQIEYVGINETASFSDLNESMEKAFHQIMSFCDKHQNTIIGTPFSIYHEWNVNKKQCKYTAAIGVSSDIEDLPGSFTKGVLQNTKAYCIRHKGYYEYLGNAWSTLYTMQQNKELKVNSKVKPIEVYINEPGTTDKKELITEVVFPTK